MAQHFIDYDKLEKISALDKDVDVRDKIMKLYEEGGELSQAVLGYIGSKTTSKSAGDTKEDVLEEACDVINIAIDIINWLGVSDEEAAQMFNKKLDKWASKSL